MGLDVNSGLIFGTNYELCFLGSVTKLDCQFLHLYNASHMCFPWLMWRFSDAWSTGIVPHHWLLLDELLLHYCKHNLSLCLLINWIPPYLGLLWEMPLHLLISKSRKSFLKYFLNYKAPDVSSLLQPAITEFLVTFTHLTFLSLFPDVPSNLSLLSLRVFFYNSTSSEEVKTCLHLGESVSNASFIQASNVLQIYPHQWPCWTPGIFVMLKYISSDTWLKKWFHSLEHLLETGFSIFTLFCDRKILLIKGSRFQDTDENTSARRWSHHAFKHELTDYGVQAESGCLLL